MSEHSASTDAFSSIAGVHILGAGVLGAFLMTMVFPPQSRREFAMRVFVALVASFLFVEPAADGVHYYLSWVNPANPSHVAAVAGLVGAVAWFLFGAAGKFLERFRTDPKGAIQDAKDMLK